MERRTEERNGHAPVATDFEPVGMEPGLPHCRPTLCDFGTVSVACAARSIPEMLGPTNLASGQAELLTATDPRVAELTAEVGRLFARSLRAAR